jgi:hypothetical protein
MMSKLIFLTMILGCFAPGCRHVSNEPVPPGIQEKVKEDPAATIATPAAEPANTSPAAETTAEPATGDEKTATQGPVEAPVPAQEESNP